MGNLINYTPQCFMTAPLGYIPDQWERFDPANLKKEQLIYYCNMVWVQYELGNDERWVQDGSLNYEAIFNINCA